MNRVLVTGGAGHIGSAVVRRLLRDPDFEVRVSDQRPVPLWMREGAEVHAGDLRVLDEARKALRGCTGVVHLAAFLDASQPFTLLEINAALDAAVVRAALDADVARCTYVSGDTSSGSARAVANAMGEALCRAAHTEHGLPFTICRLFGVYGPGLEHPVMDLLRAARRGDPLAGDADDPVALTYVDDVADAIVLAMAAPAARDEDFDVAATEPLRALAAQCWAACGNAPETLTLAAADGLAAPPPAAAKAERVLGWRPHTAPADGIARSLASLAHSPGGS